MISKHKKLYPVMINPKKLMVTPLQLFFFDKKLYLLSFNDDDSHFYINLLRTMDIKKDSITKYTATSNKSFNLKKYILNQDFIITGPIDNDFKFKYQDYYENYPFIYYFCRTKKGTPEMPSFLQSLIDLYGEDNVTVTYPKILRFKKGKPEWNLNNCIEIETACDKKVNSIVNRFKNYKEIDNYWFNEDNRL